MDSASATRREPIFNVPAVVLAVLVACVFVHVVRAYWLTGADDDAFLAAFAFIPARYDHALALRMGIPDDWGTDVWTFVTYAFIHGSWTHLVVNMVWLPLPFGSAVARRLRQLALSRLFRP